LKKVVANLRRLKNDVAMGAGVARFVVRVVFAQAEACATYMRALAAAAGFLIAGYGGCREVF
jgi:hypothetical protein